MTNPNWRLTGTKIRERVEHGEYKQTLIKGIHFQPDQENIDVECLAPAGDARFLLAQIDHMADVIEALEVNSDD